MTKPPQPGDNRGLILMYHRVAEVDSDPWGLCVSPRHFSEQLEVLTEYGTPLGLSRFIQALNRGRLPPRPIVVTFDDGYIDNLSHATPLLERYEVPATIFLVSGAMGRGREFWWDELERVLLQPGPLPKDLQLTIAGNFQSWSLREATDYDSDSFLLHRGWRALTQDDPTPRHSLYRSLYFLLQPLAEYERLGLMDDLLAWASGKPSGRLECRPVTVEEAVTLGEADLVEIGAHTVTHSLLSALSPSEQHLEIQQSKETLEELLSCPVNHFSYPYGGLTSETVALVRENGFSCAVTTAGVPVERWADPFQLPRVPVEDWNGDEFAKRLSGWSTALRPDQ